MLLLVTGSETSGVTEVAERLGRRFRLAHVRASSAPPTPELVRAHAARGGAVLSAPGLSAAKRETFLGSEKGARAVDLDHESGGGTPADVAARLFRRLLREGFRSGGRVHFAEGARDRVIDERRAEELVRTLLADLGPLRRVLLVPPDFTRFHSGAGELTALLYRLLAPSAAVSVLPALGTHAPMTSEEIARMFPGIPEDRFLVHEWRSDLSTLGEVPSEFVREVSDGKLDYSIRCELDAKLAEGGWDRIISVGQLVPHEVIGIAGHDKNIFVGTGGKDVIDRTHYLGAVCGMESIMGRAHSPVRDVLQYMSGELARHLPITHLLTVRERERDGSLVTRGLFAGDDASCFLAGAPLVQECNLELFDRPLKKVVVYLDPEEFKSTWLGNKAVYRTRMVLADGGELLVLAPGVARFGEDPDIDRLIRRYGYRGTPATLDATAREPELQASLSAAAHLIHGSSEGRFRIAYAAGGLSPEEVRSVGYEHEPLSACLERYDPARLEPGVNTLPDGEELFFVPNPALGLWGVRSAFE
jgi:nickel-dependent lactate racemase